MSPGPSWENNQLVPYLRDLEAVPTGNTTRGMPLKAWWLGLSENYPGQLRPTPARSSAANNFAALSIAPNTNIRPAADTTAGNVVADAGFGGMQQ